MPARSFAYFITVASVAMIVIVIMRVHRGWPAGPKTYAFIAATVVVIIAAIIAWRRSSVDQSTTAPRE